jgi:hypothetical protein
VSGKNLFELCGAFERTVPWARAAERNKSFLADDAPNLDRAVDAVRR